ncbi:MAG: LamG domain-containing protein [Hyphomicrobium sp.]|jgi:hypothetical protein
MSRPPGGIIRSTPLVPTLLAASGVWSLRQAQESHGLGIWPVSQDGNDTYTKILLHLNGADASTTFPDSNFGGSAHTWSAGGNAQIDTADSKFGGASLLLDGTGDYVTASDSSDFTVGSGEWTVDFWFKCNAAGGTNLRICGQCDASATTSSRTIEVLRASTNVMQADCWIGATNYRVTGTTQFTNSTNTGWHHVALVRYSGNIKLFVDGVQEGGDTAISGSINDSSSNYSVGRLGAFVSDTWDGWIDEFRFSVGIARWTTTFTPPVVAYT